MMEAINYRSALFPGERLVWEGRPPTGFLWRPIEILLIPFTLLWGGFALFWNVTVWTAKFVDLFFILWGVPFLIMGIYAIGGRFFIDAYVRARTRYMVTDRRVIIVKRDGRSIKSLDIRRLPELRLKESGDGRGTITFDRAPWYFRGRNNWGVFSPGIDAEPQFLMIPNVRSVYEMIRQQAG